MCLISGNSSMACVINLTSVYLWKSADDSIIEKGAFSSTGKENSKKGKTHVRRKNKVLMSVGNIK